jgi:hypothetical protein
MMLILAIVGIAVLANSAVDRTEDGLPWEMTLTAFCLLAVVFSAVVAKQTNVALTILSLVALCVPTYYVHNYEVPAENWELGSKYPLSSSQSAFIEGIFRASRNASRFDKALPFGASLVQLSLFAPGLALKSNTSEIYHSTLKLDDPLTKERTHDYLLVSSPRKVKGKTEGIMLLARVPAKFELWPVDFEDYTFSLQTASNVVQPPVMYGELVKLDKGPAIEHLKSKYHLRPFMLDVYKVEYEFDG